MCGGNKDCGCNKPRLSGCGCKKEEPKIHHAHVHHNHGHHGHHGHGHHGHGHHGHGHHGHGHHGHGHHGHCHTHVACGCNEIYDANSLCKSNVSCYINSNRTFSTKVMYIKHYHLDLESGC
jgi:hypothetical protein